MKHASNAKPNKTVIGLIIGTVLGAAFVGAALTLRSPEMRPRLDLKTTEVTLSSGRNLEVQVREVTAAQWQECYHAGHCTLDLPTSKDGQEYPATGLSFPDAMEFVGWLNTVDARDWRLPTFEEWSELAAEVMPEKPDPIFTDASLTWASTYLLENDRSGRTLRPSGSFATTAAGIEDLNGNVWEWTQDCYAGANGQGGASGVDRCPAYIMGGEHEAVMSYLIRDPARGGCAVGSPPAHLGMRLVSDPI